MVAAGVDFFEEFFVRALATWCVRHRRIVVTLWLVILLSTIVIGRAVRTDDSNNFSLPGTPSTKAMDLIKSVSPQRGDTEQIGSPLPTETRSRAPPTWPSSTRRSPTSPRCRTMAMVEGHPVIVLPVSGGPYKTNPQQVSADGTVAYASVTFDVTAQHVTTTEAQHFVTVATKNATKDLQIAVGGQIAEAANKMTIGGTGVGAIAAGIVLLLVFGSIFAALMPLASALVALGSATAVIGMLTHVLKMPLFSPELVVLIGLGVGIDYALFIVSRHRQGLLEGLDTETSIIQAVNTSGRAVLFAGIIVCVALLGMFALGVSFLYGLAIAASIGVAFTMIAALTLLPAILGFVGPRILSRRQRRTLATNGPRDVDHSGSSFWDRWSRFIDRRPIIPAVVALVIIGLLAAPFFSMRLGAADAGNDSVGTTTRTAYDLLAQGFGPGYNGPLQIVAKLTSTSDDQAMASVIKAVTTTPGVASVQPPLVIPEKNAAGEVIAVVEIVNAIPTSSPQSAATSDLITNLRDNVIPQALGTSQLEVYVGGVTAIYADFAGVLAKKLPLFVGVVVFVSFLLLAVVFRSLVIPLVSAAMNLLSIGAAFGILTAVFQWGWLGGLFGVKNRAPSRRSCRS